MEETGRVVVYPTYDQIVRLNRLHIERFGGEYLGLDNLMNRGSLLWVLEAIRYPLYGTMLYPTLADKAAALAWVIIREHVFYDGCKRTGISALQIFVERNGYRLDATQDERFEIALRVAGEGGEGLSLDLFAEWVGSRLVRRIE